MEYLMKYTNLYMILVFVFVFFSCGNHHYETEKIVNSILSCNIDNIDSTFQSNKAHTSFYLDSVLRGYKPSEYYKNASELIDKDFSIVYYKRLLFVRDYYSYCGNGNIIIEANTSDGDYMDFTFKKDENDIWQLVYIELTSKPPEHSLSKTTTKGFQSWNFPVNKGITRCNKFLVTHSLSGILR